MKFEWRTTNIWNIYAKERVIEYEMLESYLDIEWGLNEGLSKTDAISAIQ